MIRVAVRAVAARWTNMAGSFAALMLGVALLTTTGLALASAYGGPDRPPRWYTVPEIVVAGPSQAGGGTPGNSMLPPGERGHIPAEAVSRLTSLGRAVLDRSGYARLGNTTGARPWSAASLHRFTLTGRAPAADDDIVLTAPADHLPGDVVTVATAEGPRRFTVTGIVRTSAPPALYVTDREAARLARDRVVAVALPGSAGVENVRAALAAWPDLRILTGDARRLAEPDPEAGLLIVAASLLGTTAGIAAVVAAFVVSGTFAFGVTQRRREFALLRAAGATPRQTRRLVLWEAAVVGVPAGLSGCVAGVVAAPAFTHWMARVGLAPAGFGAHAVPWPPAVAFGIGLAMAVAGAWSAARRAGAIRPVEALREATAERRPMTRTRWAFGVGALAVAVPVIPLLRSPEGSAYTFAVALLLILGLTLLAPALVPFLVRTPPFAVRGPIGVLGRASALASPRRVASTVAPVLATVGLAGAALSGMATFSAAGAQGLRDHVTASSVVVPAGRAALPDSLTGTVRRVAGVTAAVPVKAGMAYDRDKDMIRQHSAWFVDGPAVRDVLAVPVSAGSLAELTGTATVALSRSMGLAVGRRMTLWLGDGALVRLRVVAVFDDRMGLPTVLLPWPMVAAHSAVPLPDAVYLSLAPGASVDAVVRPLGGVVTPTRAHLSTLDAEFDRLSQIALLATIGMTLVYTGISIANTQTMGTANRTAELSALRLAGATPGQLLRIVGWEAVLVLAIGTLLGGVVTAATLAGIGIALGPVTSSMPIVVPWPPLLTIIGGCAVLTLTFSLVPVIRVVR
ncbi:FtsX-like permease family protein [Streptosporangium sp. NBC_01495]|uniref:ABC transporter permease n=1 Tax=Streptosporangium sp. NBC_01495 TaxID=2903899 RepID=UPI002E319756|nr:FtsX-like permease family protein [Streptosporangium sp. NBC_01495]